MTVAEAAAACGVTRRALYYRLGKQQGLEPIRIGDRQYFVRAAVLAWKASQKWRAKGKAKPALEGGRP